MRYRVLLVLASALLSTGLGLLYSAALTTDWAGGVAMLTGISLGSVAFLVGSELDHARRLGRRR